MVNDSQASRDNEPAQNHLVTVILPTHNRADTIARSVRSVLAQTHTNLELIVVDDGSSDETLFVLGTFDDDRLRILELSERHGVSRARNAGLTACSSSLVAFQDSDDVWVRNKLVRQLAALESLTKAGIRVAAIGCRHLPIDGVTSADDGDDASVSSDPVVSLIDRFGVLAGCLGGDGTPKLLLNRAVGDPTVEFDEDLPAIEDRDFLFRFLAPGSVFGVVEEPLIAVTRGRSDHVATVAGSAAAYQRYLEKYAGELSSRSDTRDWYIYLAARELSALRSVGAVRKLLCSISQRRRLVRVELLLGLVFGRRGLALAARLGIRPDWTDRCSACGPQVWSA